MSLYPLLARYAQLNLSFVARATKKQARQFANLIARYEPEVRRAFMISVTDLQANVDWSLLIDMLTRHDIEGAIGALHIDPAAWSEYASAVTEAYAKSGASTASIIKEQGTGNIGIRFNLTNEIAQSWIKANVGEMITNITAEQVTAARGAIHSGYSAGHHPFTIARDLVGKVSERGGAREGGILGLDIPRAERLTKVVTGMRTKEGVKRLVIEGKDGSLSMRYKVNKSTEKRILAAYRRGEAVPAKERDISSTQYKNALLKARADTIAQTETANAVMGGRNSEWESFLRESGASRDDVVKRWEHRRGSSKHYRIQHYHMSGTEVKGMDTPFIMPDGTAMKYAHDPDGGAKHVINCGCDTTYYLI